jgi:hypothetical protein
MKTKFITAASLVLSLQILPIAQIASLAEVPIPPNTTNAPAKPQVKTAFQLDDGKMIRLKFVNEISSKTAEKDQAIEFQVVEDLYINNKLVVKAGALAQGYVREVKRSGMLGRKGKLDIALRQVELADGSKVRLRASQQQGGGVSGGVIAAAAILNPLFLLIKGKSVNYKQGMEFDSFVDGDFALEPSNFQSR